MRLFSVVTFLILLAINGFCQSTKRAKPFIYSAASDWQNISFKPISRPSRPDVAQPVAGRPATATPMPQSAADTDTQPIPANTAQPIAVQSDKTQPAVAQTEPTAGTPFPTNRPLATNAPLSRPNRTAPSNAPNSNFRPAFTGDFATNRNGWKAGVKGDYQYQIGLGRYSIRKRNVNTQQVAFSYVPLPTDINLNVADQFTIKIDVLADSGRVPSGGLLFGVKDSLNFNAFTINNKGEVAIVRVANGETFADYMPGDFFKPGVPVDRNRNRLTIRRKGYGLYFYVNEQEIRTSPYPFKMLAGNGIGMISSAYWTAFQKLSVTLGASGPDILPTYTSSADLPSTPVNVPDKTPEPSRLASPVTEAPKAANTGPASFSESFANNQNRWLVGKKNGYEFDMSPGNYYIQKKALSTTNPAHSYINLPETLDLNKVKSFTITVDMVVPPGIQPDAGLLIGVKNNTTFCQFRLIGTNKVSIKSITNGTTFANYMPGKPTPPQVTVNRERNTLTVKKELNQLHFYINGKEVEDSPHVFRPFKGNGVGFITASPTVKFQNLTVQTQPE